MRVAHLVGRVQTEVVWGRYVAADHLIDRLDREMPYSEAGAHTIGLVINVAAARGPEAARDRIEWRLDRPDLGGQPPHARSEVAAANGLRHLVEGSYGQALALLDQALRSRSALFTGASAVLASLLETSRALGASASQNRNLRSSLGAWWPDRYGERYAGSGGSLRRALRRAARSSTSGSGPPSTAAAWTSRSTWRGPTWRTDAVCCRPDGFRTPTSSWSEPRRCSPTNGCTVGSRTSSGCGPSRRPPAVDADLTPTEREIVALVLQRRTNAEIARQLFMSKRTIELHLTRVFRKVGVARKSQLIELDTVRDLVGPPSRSLIPGPSFRDPRAVVRGQGDRQVQHGDAGESAPGPRR